MFQFMGEHPFLTFLLFYMILQTIIIVTRVLTGKEK